MKKRYVALIVVSSVVLVFGSLIAYAITAFPELLMTEEQKKEKARLAQMEEDVYFEDAYVSQEDNYYFENESVDYNIVIEDAVPIETVAIVSNIIVDIPAELYEDVVFIAIDAQETVNNEVNTINDDVVINDDNASFTFESGDDFVNEEITQEEIVIVEEIIEETTVMKSAAQIVDSSAYTILNDKDSEEEIVLECKEKNYQSGATSHNKILDCTLIVIGIVDVLSLLLIRKRKRLSHF